MKKLITVCALCAAMSAMAVDSQNIVGYLTISVPKGLTVWTPMFDTVGGDGTQTTLGDIIPSSSFYGDNSGGMLQFLNVTGAGNVTRKAEYWDGYGWYDFDTGNEINALVLPKGQSFIVSASAIGGATFTIKGQVRTTTFTVSVPKGLSIIGNSLPKNLTFADIVPSPSFYGDNSGGMLQFLNPTGAGNVTLKAEYWDGYGWYDFNTGNELNANVIPAGASFIVSASAVGGATFTFPAAL